MPNKIIEHKDGRRYSVTAEGFEKLYKDQGFKVVGEEQPTAFELEGIPAEKRERLAPRDKTKRRKPGPRVVGGRAQPAPATEIDLPEPEKATEPTATEPESIG